MNWKTPRKCRSIPRRLSMIVVCLHPSYYAQFLCQESVNRNQDSNKFSPGAPTPKRPKAGINHGKRRGRRREGAGDKAPECAIAAGRWVGRQTRCLVSVLTKRGINSMKQANLYYTHKYMHNEFPRGSTDAREFKCTGSTGTESVCA